MRIYVDKFIIIDFLDNKRANFKKACHFFEICNEKEIELYISSKSISDIYFILKKTFSDRKTLKEIIYKISQMITIVDTCAADIMEALNIANNDYEDAIAIQIAKSNSIDIIVTDNVSDFNKELINVYSLETFIDKFGNEGKD